MGTRIALSPVRPVLQIVATLAAIGAVACGSPTAPTPSTGAARLARTRFLAFGDSITAGEVTVPLPALSGGAAVSLPQILVPIAAYPTVVNDLLWARYPAQARAISIVNAGRPAEAMIDAFPRYTDQFEQARPEVLLLLGGYNDLFGLGLDGVERGSAAIRAIAVDARNRGARVFVGTLTPNRPNRQRTIAESLLLAYNDRIRSIANAERLVLVDLYPALLAGADNYIGVDGLHPTEIGYRRIAETFFAAVVSDLETR